MGQLKTYDKIARRYFWPKMRKDIIDYVNSCKKCQFRKLQLVPKAGLMVPITVNNPFDTIGCDLLGPFRKSKSGNTFIIAATDFFTKWSEAKAIPAATKEHCADFILDRIVTKHGCPKVLLTDRGPQFRSLFSEIIYKRIGIKHLMTTAYWLQCNGLVEKFNQTLGKSITMYVDSEQSNWDEGLQAIVFSYNTSIHPTTKYSPFFLVYGREPKLPSDRVIDPQAVSFVDNHRYIINLDKKLYDARKIAKRNIELAAEKSKQTYDKTKRDINYKIGDQVLIRYPIRKVGLSEKLLNKYKGPFEVTKAGDNGVSYDIKGYGENDKLIIDKVHISRMKPYCNREKLINRIENEEISVSESDSSSTSYIEIDSENEITDNYINQSTDSDETVIYEYEEPLSEPDEGNLVHVDARNVEPVIRPVDEVPFPQNLETPVVVPTGTPIASTPPTLVKTSPQGTPASEYLTPEPTPVPLRRSQRPRKPRKLFDLLTFALILCLTQSSDCSLNKVNPIVWRKSDSNVITGINRVFLTAKYDSPCLVFDDDNFQTYKPKELKSWCEQAFNENFIDPLLKFCPSTTSKFDDNTELHRNKRVAIVAIGIIALISVVVTATIGIGAKALVNSNNNHYTLDEVKNQQNKMLAHLEKLENNHEKIKRILSSLQDEIDNIESRLDTIGSSLNSVVNNIPLEIIYTSTIASKLILTRDRLIDISRNWKSGKTDIKLTDIFNFSLPCGDDCPFDLATPKSCEVDLNRRMIKIVIDAKTLNSEVKILKSDPFVFYNDKANTQQICSATYTGPDRVLYYPKRDCVIPLTHQSENDDTIGFAPNLESCELKYPDNLTSIFWKVKGCVDKHTLLEEDIIQIKSVGQENYIYCDSLNIKVYDKQIKCPVYAFSLPNTVSFRIGQLEYTAKESQTSGTIQFPYGLNHRINTFLMPNIHSFDFQELSNNVRKNIDNLNNNLENIDAIRSSISYTDIILIISLTLLILLIIIYKLFRYYTMSDPNPNITNLGGIELAENITIDSVNRETEGVYSVPSRRVRLSSHPIVIATIVMLIINPVFTLRPNSSIILNIEYGNPCIQLINASQFETKWCQNLFDTHFIQELDNFCLPNPTLIVIERKFFKKRLFKRNEIQTYPKFENNTNIAFETTANKLIIATIASEMLSVRNTIKSIGLSWIKGVVDKNFVDFPYLSIEFLNTMNVDDFEPFNCIHFRELSIIKIEIIKKYDSIFFNLESIYSFEKTFISICIILTIISFILTIKILCFA